MFGSYQAEYRWLLSYQDTYGTCPPKETFCTKFRDFPVQDVRDVPFYCDEVLYGYQKREAVKVIKTAASYLQEDDLDEALLTLGSFRAINRAQPLVDALKDQSFLESYHETVKGLATPWETVNGITGGIRPGDFWTTAARYGQGKSWILGHFIANTLLSGHNVLMYSLEMPKAQVLTRVHVLLGALLGHDVDHVAMRDRVYDSIAYKKILESIEELVHGQLFIMDSGKVTSARIKAEAPKADLTVVDYLGLMYTNTGQPAIGDWRNMATISNQIKQAALDSDSRIVCAAQINREGDTAKKLPPRSKTLSQSDAIGQDSDVIVMMKKYAKTALVGLVDKNRHGEDNVHFYTEFQPNVGKFNEITKEKAEDRRYEEDFDDE
jgi:replicative DNA helicase